MVLRPYQVYAVEALVERVKNTRNNGYIWHTTGSGKTLTSFKAAKLIAQIDNVEKVLFVVDRVDLDYQTMRSLTIIREIPLMDQATRGNWSLISVTSTKTRCHDNPEAPTCDNQCKTGCCHAEPAG